MEDQSSLSKKETWERESSNLKSPDGERKRMETWKTWLIRQHMKNMSLSWQMISLVTETDLETSVTNKKPGAYRD